MANVALESLSIGRPVIASNVGGNPFMVKHLINGMLVESENPGALAEAIEFVYQNPDELENMAERASKSVAHFTWDSVAKTIFDAFDKKFSGYSC